VGDISDMSDILKQKLKILPLKVPLLHLFQRNRKSNLLFIWLKSVFQQVKIDTMWAGYSNIIHEI